MAESENQDTSNDSFRELLERFTDWCRENDPIFYKSLRPGMSPKAIQAMENEFGFSLREDFKTVYAWRDGQEEIDREAIGYVSNPVSRVWQSRFMPHTEVIEYWKLLNECNSIDGIDAEKEAASLNLSPEFGGVQNWWNPQWIPFLDFRSGDCLCVDQAGFFDGVPGQVIRYVHDDDYRSIRYPSLYAWIEMTLGTVQQPEFYFDGEMGNDFIEWDAYVGKHYPGYPWIFPRPSYAEAE